MKRMAALLALTLLGSAACPTAVHAVHDTETLGTPVQRKAAQTVTIDPSTQLIRVEHLNTVTIRNQRGQSFSWKFDTFYVPTGFPLSSIAPAHFDAGETWVYVQPRPQFSSD